MQRNQKIAKQQTQGFQAYKKGQFGFNSPKLSKKLKIYPKQILKKLTINLLKTYQKCNPNFQYKQSQNPKRELTKDCEAVKNMINKICYDNKMSHYICYKDDQIVSPENDIYIIQELLGSGTFGQVVSCYKKYSDEKYAVKIVKSEPAYSKAALKEIHYLISVNSIKESKNKIIELLDYFVFRNHVVLIFPVLDGSLLDIIQQTKHEGFNLKLIRRIALNMLEAQEIMESNQVKLIHCDLKPENYMVKEKGQVVLIDLGSSCYYNDTTYTYIQSRFYRAPEILLGTDYSYKIDMWSIGCVIAELYLGLPIFLGNSEYDMIIKISHILGMPSQEMIHSGKKKNQFFEYNNNQYTLIDKEKYCQSTGKKLSKRYFDLNSLEDFRKYYSRSKYRTQDPDANNQLNCFIHFLKGLLQINSNLRWNTLQALQHPFIKQTPFNGFWYPPGQQNLIKLQKQFTFTVLPLSKKVQQNQKQRNRKQNQFEFNNENQVSFRPNYNDQQEQMQLERRQRSLTMDSRHSFQTQVYNPQDRNYDFFLPGTYTNQQHTAYEKLQQQQQQFFDNQPYNVNNYKQNDQNPYQNNFQQQQFQPQQQNTPMNFMYPQQNQQQMQDYSQNFDNNNSQNQHAYYDQYQYQYYSSNQNQQQQYQKQDFNYHDQNQRFQNQQQPQQFFNQMQQNQNLQQFYNNPFQQVMSRNNYQDMSQQPIQMNNFQHSSTFNNNDYQQEKDASQQFKMEDHGTNLNKNQYQQNQFINQQQLGQQKIDKTQQNNEIQQAQKGIQKVQKSKSKNSVKTKVNSVKLKLKNISINEDLNLKAKKETKKRDKRESPKNLNISSSDQSEQSPIYKKLQKEKQKQKIITSNFQQKNRIPFLLQDKEFIKSKSKEIRTFSNQLEKLQSKVPLPIKYKLAQTVSPFNIFQGFRQYHPFKRRTCVNRPGLWVNKNRSNSLTVKRKNISPKKQSPLLKKKFKTEKIEETIEQ